MMMAGLTAEEQRDILWSYHETFGELPDRRRMSEEALDRLVELAQIALARGARISDKEAGLADPPPEMATI